MKAKYELKNGNILKDGHTMFLEDIVQDLRRKSYLENTLKTSDKAALNIANVVGSDLLHDLLEHEEEITSSPLRFNGVHVARIKQVFERHGIPYNSSF